METKMLRQHAALPGILLLLLVNGRFAAIVYTLFRRATRRQPRHRYYTSFYVRLCYGHNTINKHGMAYHVGFDVRPYGTNEHYSTLDIVYCYNDGDCFTVTIRVVSATLYVTAHTPGRRCCWFMASY